MRSIMTARPCGAVHRTASPEVIVHIDCQRCPARGSGCQDCLVAFFLDTPPAEDGLLLDAREAAAVHAFRCAGLVSDVEAARVRAVRTTGALAGVG